eukprot:PhF_6_TR1069/c3_g1_i2/m.2249/K08867/WNK, PRKWNK; WNK lysine deficient protein kinase
MSEHQQQSTTASTTSTPSQQLVSPLMTVNNTSFHASNVSQVNGIVNTPSSVCQNGNGMVPVVGQADSEVADPSHRFFRKRKLAKGQYKEVYKAFDEEEALEVAWNEIDCSARCIDLQKVHREVQLLHDIDYAHVIKFHTSWFDEERKCFIFITELMTSGTLKDFIAAQSSKRIRPKIMKKWCRQILSGLQYLHHRNIMHRDLKCDNIFINGNRGEVKIGDLGLSVSGVVSARTVTGTPEFMAPEIYEENYTNSVDIWSFGMCALEMATGEYPYSECENVGQVYRKVSTGVMPMSLQKVTDPLLLDMLKSCLSVDPAQRPTATALLESCPFLQPEQDEISEVIHFPTEDGGNTQSHSNAESTCVSPNPHSQLMYHMSAASALSGDDYIAWVERGPKLLRTTLLQLGLHHGLICERLYQAAEQQNNTNAASQTPSSGGTASQTPAGNTTNSVPTPFVPRKGSGKGLDSLNNTNNNTNNNPSPFVANNGNNSSNSKLNNTNTNSPNRGGGGGGEDPKLVKAKEAEMRILTGVMEHLVTAEGDGAAQHQGNDLTNLSLPPSTASIINVPAGGGGVPKPLQINTLSSSQSQAQAQQHTLGSPDRQLTITHQQPPPPQPSSNTSSAPTTPCEPPSKGNGNSSSFKHPSPPMPLQQMPPIPKAIFTGDLRPL